jgi:hypothetical protein
LFYGAAVIFNAFWKLGLDRLERSNHVND